MRWFRRKQDYFYDSSYSNGKYGRAYKRRMFLIGAVTFLIVVTTAILLNLTRIKLMMKGYSFSETNQILTLTAEEEEIILKTDKLDTIIAWMKHSNVVARYGDYEKYASYNPKMKKKEVVAFMDAISANQVPKLQSLSYSEDLIWELLKYASKEDLTYLVDKGYTASEIEGYQKIKGYEIQNTHLYIETYKESKDYAYSVNIVNYPFINATNEAVTTYEITDPENIATLVKKGFYLPEDYEPSDLVVPNIPIAPDCEDSQLRQEAANALETMASDAQKEGYYLVLNSAYRSYSRQQEVYQQFEDRYGGMYAAEYVALPGASEHQTGLGVDLTSQSVIDGQRLVFGDTEEYDWVLKNAHHYGFIVRFPTETAKITGIAHEPWHLRYVGTEMAKEIYDNTWVLEQYCLYKSVLPKVKER